MKEVLNKSSVPRILIAEDSPTQAQKLAFILSKRSYETATVRNGREALSQIQEHPPSLVITDIVMPEMDGYELCTQIKRNEKFASIPVILLTSLTDPIDVVRGLESGADNFIFKPFEEDYLLARVAYMLANQHLRENDIPKMGLEIFFGGRRFFITSDRLQILNLLLSTYEAAVQRNRELTTARDQLRELNDVLEIKVKERTSALQAEVQERKRAEDQVRSMNLELEARVKQRTSQLEAANAELEAFSYSVSHDLRAPLRHISGFMGLLEKRSAAVLDEKSKEYLKAISDAGKKMGNLIDDLLSFSRMSRTEIVERKVEVSKLVEEVIKDLAPEIQHRSIEWRIEPLPEIQADVPMLKQVFVNLLSNAVKYTGPRENAIIRIGAEEKPDSFIFFIEDNGVGFEMDYADKLFGVFQRLHRSDEFEGTGIGLANVRRIIARHGGATWAVGRPQLGATFYFSIPKKTTNAK